MNHLLKLLYRYAVDHKLETYLADEQEALRDNAAMQASAEARMDEALSPELWECFDNYASARNLEEDLRSEAAFASGLSLGLALGRL